MNCRIREWTKCWTGLHLVAFAAFGLALAGAPGFAYGDQDSGLVSRLRGSGCLAQGRVDPSSKDIVTAIADCPPIDPVFRVDREISNSKINRIGTDHECRIIVTASEDKTARVYQGDGRLLGVLRPPTGPGNGGKLRAVAVSPDGTRVAVAGWDVAVAKTALPHPPGATSDNAIYIFNPLSGELLRRLGGFPYDFKALVFSPDGTRLAATFGGSVVVLDTQRFAPIFRDDTLNNVSYGLAFGPEGTLVVGTVDGLVRKYATNGKVIASAQYKGFGIISGLAVHPDAGIVAMTSLSSTGVAMLKSETLQLLGALETAGMEQTPLGILAGDASGNLAGGGMFLRKPEMTSQVRIWKGDGSGRLVDIPIKGDSVNAIAPCSGGFVFATQSPTLQRVDLTGKVIWRIDTPGMIAFYKTEDAFQVSGDGTRLWFGLEIGAKDPVEFDLMTERLLRKANPPEGLTKPLLGPPTVSDWKMSVEPKLKGKPLPHEPNEMFRALAQLPDGSGFVLGSEFQMWRYDAKGKVVWPLKSPAPVHGVNVPANGQMIVAAYADSTIRWHRISDGTELLSLYVDRTSLAWIAWTPSGYFMSSPGGDNLAGWQLNRGFGNAADFFPMSRFRDQFYRPDIVKLILAKLDEGAAIEAANAGREEQRQKDLASVLPPIVTIVAPAEGVRLSESKVAIEYVLRAPSGKPADSIEVLLNGRPSGINVKPPDGPVVEGSVRSRLEVALPQGLSGDVEIGLVARSGPMYSVVASTRVVIEGSPTPDDLLKPTLYALIIGVGDYTAANVKPLKYAVKDAQDMEILVERQKGGLYGDVKPMKLVDSDATTINIKKGLSWLNASVTRHDVGLIFLAGHGVTDEQGKFWFLTADANKDRLAETALSKDDLASLVNGLRGRVIVFLDACHAGNAAGASVVPMSEQGNVDLNALMGDLTVSGQDMVIFSSSTGREFSFESPDWNNGAFTLAVTEAIGQGKADLLKTGRITSSLLDAYAAARVTALTGGRQHPLMFRPSQSADFDIAAVR